MKSTFFDRGQDLVLIEAHLVGPRSDARLNLVLDTGASNTIVTPDVIDRIGYSARDGHGFSSISSPLGREFGYRIRVGSFEALGFPFLEKFHIEVRMSEHRIRLALADRPT